MPIRVLCPQCETSYNLADTLAGKKIRCKKCEAIVAVPAANAPASAPAAAPAAKAAVPPPLFGESEPAPKPKPRPAPVPMDEADMPPPPPPRAKPRPAPLEDEDEAPPPRRAARSAAARPQSGGKPKLSGLARNTISLFVASIVFAILSAVMVAVAFATIAPGKRTPDDIYQYLIAAPALLSALCMVLVPLLWLIWLGRAWSNVPTQYGGMSGLKAVGLLFIPIFSIYWIFRVVPGLSTALTKTLEARAPDGPTDAGYGAGLAALIMNFVGFGWLAWIPGLMWLSAADRAVTRVQALDGAPVEDED
jgi:hypothetical protein